MAMTDDSRSDNAFERDKPGTVAQDRAEAAIEKVRRLGGIFVEAVRAMRTAMVLTDPTLPGNPIVFANQSFLNLSGYAMDEVLGQQPYFMNGPDTDPADAERFRRILESDQDGVVETIQYAKDGRRFVATLLLSAFKDETGTTLHHFLSWTDVTRQVEAENEASELRRTQLALRESEAKYRGLFNSIDEGFCVIEMLFDADGRPADYVFRETNAAFERQTGLNDAIGRRMRELAPDHEQHWFDIYGRIATTGEARRFDQPAEALGRWFDVYAFRVGDPDQRQVAVLFNDVADRKRAEIAVHASDERHRFLLALGDATRAQSTAEGKIEVAARYLGERLNASRVLWAEYDWEKNLAYIFNGWFADGARPFPTVMQLDHYDGEVLNDLKAGRTVRIDNVGLRTDDPSFAAIADVGVQALLSPPLLVDGKLRMNLSIHQQEPRHWTEDEVALVQEVAERLWAEVGRARVEASLHGSEERMRLIVESARDYAIFTTDADLRVTRWLPGAQSVFGWTREEIEGRSADILFTPEDRADGAPQEEAETALRDGKAPDIRWHLRKDGRRVFIEGQVVPLREGGRHHGFLKIGQDVTVRRAAEEALRGEQRRQQTLLAELQHRVRNTLAVIRSIVRRTAQSSDSVEDFEQHLDGRLSAFARTQAYVTRDPDGGIDLELIVRDELLAHAADGGPAVSIQGPEVRLSAKQAETIGLAVHELTSNAIKHGALCDEGNRIEVAWSIEGAAAQRKLHFRWIERLRDRRLAPPKRNGFGTELLDRVMRYELDAEPEIAFKPTGFEYRAIFPLAPVPAKSLT